MKAVLCALALFVPSLCLSEPYAGIAVGCGFVDDACSDDNESYAVDDASPLLRAFFGYEREVGGVGLAVEFAYLYSDDMDIDVDFSIEVSGGLDDEFDIKAVGGDFLVSCEDRQDIAVRCNRRLPLGRQCGRGK